MQYQRFRGSAKKQEPELTGRSVGTVDQARVQSRPVCPVFDGLDEPGDIGVLASMRIHSPEPPPLQASRRNQPCMNFAIMRRVSQPSA
jgi:hypothetical protein